MAASNTDLRLQQSYYLNAALLNPRNCRPMASLTVAQGSPARPVQQSVRSQLVQQLRELKQRMLAEQRAAGAA